MITAIVPAAGASTRMGRPKASLPWGETTVLGQVVANLWAGGVDDILVVTTEAEAWVPGAEDRARAVHVPEGSGGTMTESLQVGIRNLAPACTGVLVLLADQPMISPEVIRRVVSAHADHGHDLAAAAYRGRRGHPVLFGRAYFGELLNLTSEEPPRKVVEGHRDVMWLVEAGSEAVLADLDTPAAYAAWHRRLAGRPLAMGD